MKANTDIKGIAVQFSFQGQEIISDSNDGYLGRLKPGSGLVKVCIQPGYEILGLNVDGQKDVTVKRDYGKDEDRVFQMKVGIKLDKKWQPCAMYPHNNMRLLELGNEPRLYEVALVSQNGEFFLTSQPSYNMNCYRDSGGKLVCPEIKDWPSMISLLEELLKGMELPSIDKYEPEPVITVNGLSRNKGRVLWYNYAMGLGTIITSEEKAVRVHWSQISQRPRFRFLKKGEVVRFQHLRNVRTKRTSAFQQEAVRVRINRPRAIKRRKAQ